MNEETFYVRLIEYGKYKECERGCDAIKQEKQKSVQRKCKYK